MFATWQNQETVKSCWFSAWVVTHFGGQGGGTTLAVAPLGAHSMQQELKSRLLLPLYLTPVDQWCIKTQLVCDQGALYSVLAVLSAHWRLLSTRANHRRQSGCRMRIKGRCTFLVLQTGMLVSLLATSPNILIVTPELSAEGKTTS